MRTVPGVQNGKIKVYFIYHICRYDWNHRGPLIIQICRIGVKSTVIGHLTVIGFILRNKLIVKKYQCYAFF